MRSGGSVVVYLYIPGILSVVNRGDLLHTEVVLTKHLLYIAYVYMYH